jgi:Flp pilus assembly protein TadD
LIQGIISFFHRDKPGRISIFTSGAAAGVEGTEFVMKVETVNGIDVTTLSVIDGLVRFYNNQGPALTVTNLQEAIASPGQAPRYMPGFIANNRLQWCFYYPGVLDLGDLPLSAGEQQALADSLNAYRQGDLLNALVRYPEGRQPASDAERIYYAAVLLAVGQVDKTLDLLTTLGPTTPPERLGRLAGALRQLIAAVKRQPNPVTEKPELATEFVAASYWEQSQSTNKHALEIALSLARQAVNVSPGFGFGWERVAELEFSFGRTARASEALGKSLELAPRNAQALALKGFLLAAQNHIRQAIEEFNQAREVDPALGNIWLGRGLCRIRRGDLAGGREDLLIAAALEPQRSTLRSYLAKAYQEAGDWADAAKELKLAQNLDPNDPTPWLYSALLNQQENRINEGVRDLEKSQELNDNRSVYRSRLLLDQDRAVRSANLAAIYQDAGMIDWSVLEASRAVSYDYANYSAHLFLANSFDQLRDPNRINLRYETPADSEYLVANLLAPVQAGSLSPAISQQEYSRMFERDGLHLSSDTEYLSRGAWTESAAQYGVFGNSSYDLEAFYRTDPGQRPNNDFEEKAFTFQIKQQLTPHDTLFFQGSYYDANGRDLLQYYYQTNANLGLRTKETQNPNLLAGYHHEWSPGMHTLVLVGRLTDDLSVTNPTQQTYFVDHQYLAPPPVIGFVQPITVPQDYQSTTELYTAELQQIWQTPEQVTIVGGRFQTGEFHTENLQRSPKGFIGLTQFPPNYAANQDITTDFERFTLYAYHTHQLFDRLLLTAGLAYDWVNYPENFRAAPISSEDKTVDQLGPKAGLIWTPTDNTTIRAAYTRSLGGASFDQSLRLEPSTVAGFLQSFRSIIPESIGGTESGAEFETFGFALEQRFATGTYLGLTGEILDSEVDRVVGVFLAHSSADRRKAAPAGMPEHLGYGERALVLTVDQLIESYLSAGVRYRIADANLTDTFPAVAADLPQGSLVPPFQRAQELGATLQQLNLYAIFNHPSGFFAEVQGIWTGQSNRGYSPELRDSDFWQVNFFAGYRFNHRRAELALGLLNVTGQNYNLNPLTLYNDLPRSRTLAVRLRFNF